MKAPLELREQGFYQSTLVADNPIRETFFAKHILKVGHSIMEDENDYSLEDTLFTNVGVLGAINVINSAKKIDGILISPELATSKIQALRGLAKEKAIPYILYTSKYAQEHRDLALRSGMDDYFYGNISDSSMKRITFINKLKAYKKTRGDKPYDNPQVEEIAKIKLWTLKRTFDILVSASALIFLSPLLLLIAILVKLDSKGPVFYISKRAGSGYRIFDFYKFRTMRVGADSDLSKLSHLNQYGEPSGAVFFKIKNDPRVTRLGQFLRDTSLDELPQFVNVLLGDMSLVGNRPLPLYEAKQLTKDQIAWRFLAPAGITGLWQITKRGKENMSEEERIKLDMEYAIKNSFIYDIMILLGTFPALLQKQKV
jgi:lipopolysaccharide/colanic/teichoic acid biosynthesis glycosyltransferase